MSVCLWNARSIVNKLSGLLSFVYFSSIAIFALTETWLSDSFCDGEILPSHFTVYRRDRSSRGGGVVLAVHSSPYHPHILIPLLTWRLYVLLLPMVLALIFYFVSFMFPLR